MPPESIRALLTAYRTTRYTVRLADREVRIRAGAAPPPALRTLLHPDRFWVLISACNPIQATASHSTWTSLPGIGPQLFTVCRL